MTRSVMIALVAGVLAVVQPAVSGASEKPLRVVATLSTFGDLAKTIGGEHVEVETVAPPRFNPHFIEPRPSDVRRVKRADLLIHAGLDLELWRGPLVDAAGNRRVFPGGEGELDLSRGIPLLEVPDRALTRAEGDIHLYGNPHYWLDPENGKRMAQAICDKLCLMDPAHEQAYHRNLRDFLDRLDRKVPAWKKRLAPFRGREVVGYHNAWPYLMGFSGLTMRYFLEPKPGIPPTPKQVGFVEQHVRESGIRAVVQSTFDPPEAARAVAKRTGATVVLLCQNVGELPAASDYIALLEYNVQQLVEALGGPADG